MDKITKPGIYDIPSKVYHADPCPEPSLSNSIAKTLCARTPMHAWWSHPQLNPNFEPVNKTSYDFGTACHALLLGDPCEFEIVEASSWQTNAAKELKAQAYAEDKTPLLTEQYDNCNAMVEAAKSQIKNIEELAPFLADDAISEQTLIWQEKGFWFRSRVDRMSKNKLHLFDYKTTGGSAHPEQWSRICYNNFFDMQHAFYTRFFNTMYNGLFPNFTFIVQETEPPYLLCPIRLDGIGIEMAERRTQWAVDMWQRCLSQDMWPSYPNNTSYMTPPFGQSRAWLEDEGNELSNMRTEMQRLMFENQKPIKNGEI